jgi:hypothetical protein
VNNLTSIIVNGRVVDLIIFLVIMISMYLTIQQAKTGKAVKIRALPAFDAIEEAIGRAVEAGRPVHYTTGTHSFQGQTAGGSSALAAGLSLLAYIADLSLSKGANLMVSCPYPEIYTIESDILREAYVRAGMAQEYSDEKNLRYVPLVSSCAPYAAGVAGWLQREKPGANFLLGPFFFESLIIAEAGYYAGAFQVAGTTSAGYSAFFLACCDYVLIGEELYAAQALATGDPIQEGSLRGNDVNRAWILALIVLGILATMIGLNSALNGLLNI